MLEADRSGWLQHRKGREVGPTGTGHDGERKRAFELIIY